MLTKIICLVNYYVGWYFFIFVGRYNTFSRAKISSLLTNEHNNAFEKIDNLNSTTILFIYPYDLEFF